MEENSESSGISTVTLNIHEGMVGKCLDRMITERARSSGAKRTADKRKRKGETVVANLKETKRLSSGVLVSHGIHSLNDPHFLEVYNNRGKESLIRQSKQRMQRKRDLIKNSWCHGITQ